MFKNNCLRRSRPFPIRKRRGRFWGIFTCTKVRKNTYEYSTFFHLSTFLHHLLQERWAKIRIFIVWLSAYVIISLGVIMKMISEGNIYYHVYWYPAVTLLSRILISLSACDYHEADSHRLRSICYHERWYILSGILSRILITSHWNKVIMKADKDKYRKLSQKLISSMS